MALTTSFGTPSIIGGILSCVGSCSFSSLFIAPLYLHLHNQQKVTESIQLLLCLITISIYRVYFHPLSKYPGPRLWAASQLPWVFYTFKGTLPFKINKLHKQYGPVVRIAPHELSYTQEEAWQDIYGKPSPRNIQLQRDSTLYVKPEDSSSGLMMEQNDEAHARMR
jgi:hypothetical protein